MTDTFKGFVQPTKNYFPVPNEWIDICAEIDNLAELKVIQYVLRHTWGFQEFGITKTISTDEFMHGRKRTDGTRIDNGTGLKSDRSVKDGLKNAIKHGYLVYEVDATDKARTKKSYALKMQAPVDGYILPPQIGQVDTTPLAGSIYLSGVQNLPIGGTKSTYRSEKDTKETHLKKDTVERQENASANAPAARTPFSSQQAQGDYHGTVLHRNTGRDMSSQIGTDGYRQIGDTPQAEPIRIATTAPQVVASEQEDVPPDENNSHSHGEVTQAKPTATKPARTAKAKVVELVPTAEEQAILDMWQSIFKRRIPINEALIKAAGRLVPCEPTLQDLKDCRGFCYTSNGEWYKKKGVQLSDIVSNWAKWQTTLELPPAEEAPLPDTRDVKQYASRSSNRVVSSFSDPNFNFEDEFYPSEAERRAEYAEAD